MTTAVVKEYVTSRWDEWSSTYDDQYAHGLKTEEEKRAWLDILERELGAPSKKILDIGTGTGFLAIMAARLGHYCLGVDLSEEMLRKAREKSENYNGYIAFEIGDAERLELPDNKFDAVVNRHLLWTLPNPEAALKEWLRVLKSGGKLVIINAAWSTFGLGNKLRGFLGKL
ncbi:MAG: class I SAM-dependent methyltransferase, partial [Desulfitobacterium hafniense]|nr:class I SAM-dependent methyltransferase [Desulfitobacterium hafniense]